MSTKPVRHDQIQLDLFLPPSPRPQWATLPPEVRQKVLPLLVRLIRDQSGLTFRSPAGKETNHE